MTAYISMASNSGKDTRSRHAVSSETSRVIRVPTSTVRPNRMAALSACRLPAKELSPSFHMDTMLAPERTTAAMLMAVSVRRPTQKPSSVLRRAPASTSSMGSMGSKATSGATS